jgi:hypothetical protein
VLVALNRGYRYSRRSRSDDEGIRDPHYYVFPVDVVRRAQRPGASWGKVYKRHMEKPEQYRDRWDLIRLFLGLPP